MDKIALNKIKIREATGAETQNWDELIAQFSHHRVTHTLAWIRSLESSIKGQSKFLVYEKNNEIVGAIPGMLTKVGPFRLFGSPLAGWQTASMGPVFDQKQVTTDEIAAPLILLLQENYGVHHLEMSSHHLDHSAMKKTGFTARSEPTFCAPLYPDDLDRTFNAIKPAGRRNIRRAQKLGLETVFTDDEAFVNEVYDQLGEVYLRGGNVVPFGKKRVLSLFRELQKDGRLLAIGVYLPDGKTCIATGLFIVENKELLLWSWTYRTAYGWHRPTELMTWTVMKKAMEMGCEKFDFVGRGDFKKKFGAQLDETKIRWIRSRYRWLTGARNLAEKIYRWQQSMRGRFIRRNSSGVLKTAKTANKD